MTARESRLRWFAGSFFDRFEGAMGFSSYFSSLSSRSWRWLGLRFFAAIALCGMAGWLVGEIVLQRQVDQLSVQSRHHVEFYRLSLESLLSRNASLPRIIAREDQLKYLLKTPASAESRLRANQYLQTVQHAADINAAFLLDSDGMTLAASNFQQQGSYVGNNYGFRPYFRDAMLSGLGVFYGIGATTGDPGYFLAAPIEERGTRIGAVTVKISLDDFEAAMRRSGDKVFLVDANGVVFLSSLPEWKYRSLEPLAEGPRQRMEVSRQYHERPILPLRDTIRLQEAPYIQLVTLPGTKPQKYLVHSVPAGSLGWSIVLLSQTANARQSAILSGGLAGLAMAFALSMVIYFRLSIRRYNERRQADVTLRKVIAERTADLRATNASLEERVEALKTTERILRETQDDAVQAGKLAVLGQMAAGISHELNQPLTALHTFSDNAVDLLDRGHLADVRENLGFIKQMALRMGRIAGEIKNFTRKQPLEKQAVSVFGVVVQAAMLVEARRKQADVLLVLPEIADQVAVMADPQRLEQVLVNLLLNAIDAVAGSENRCVEVVVDDRQVCIGLAVRDTGAGIPEAVLPHLFEPFFTTKASGQGVGLGLVISRMIVQELGGEISVCNLESAGAEFCVWLEKA